MPTQGQSLVVHYVAMDPYGALVSGDAANHTLKVVRDGTAATPTNTPAATSGLPGYYQLTLTPAETTGVKVVAVGGTSSTAGVSLLGEPVYLDPAPLVTAEVVRQIAETWAVYLGKRAFVSGLSGPAKYAGPDGTYLFQEPAALGSSAFAGVTRL